MLLSLHLHLDVSWNILNLTRTKQNIVFPPKKIVLSLLPLPNSAFSTTYFTSWLIHSFIHHFSYPTHQPILMNLSLECISSLVSFPSPLSPSQASVTFLLHVSSLQPSSRTHLKVSPLSSVPPFLHPSWSFSILKISGSFPSQILHWCFLWLECSFPHYSSRLKCHLLGVFVITLSKGEFSKFFVPDWFLL